MSPQGFIGNWPSRLWNMDKHYHYIGGQGAGGMGYGAPAAVGAALANRKYGRLSINIQTDGDLNYAPGVLWTAAHHKIPLLTIMHNNRGVSPGSDVRASGWPASTIAAPTARTSAPSCGSRISTTRRWRRATACTREGPITDPKDLAPALKRGIERVKKGEPVLIDVVTQPR